MNCTIAKRCRKEAASRVQHDPRLGYVFTRIYRSIKLGYLAQCRQGVKDVDLTSVGIKTLGDYDRRFRRSR